MSSKTPNFNLTKPSADDFYDIEVQNGNMDIVDTELKKLNDGKAPSGHGLGSRGAVNTNISFLEILRKGSGFYIVGDAEDTPYHSGEWLSALQISRQLGEGAETGTQMAFSEWGSVPKMWLKTTMTGTPTNWFEMLHTGNIANYANVKIKCGTYQGDGNYGSSYPNNLPFDFKPQIVLLLGDGTEDTEAFICVRPRSKGYALYSDGSSTHRASVAWGEKGISWYRNSSSNQLNSSGVTYHYIAIG